MPDDTEVHRFPFGPSAGLEVHPLWAKIRREEPVAREDVPRTTPRPAQPSALLSMDPPEHTRLRLLISRAFTGRRVEQLRPRAQEIVEAHLEQIERSGPPADLVRGFALPLPVTLICEMLGVPPEDQHRFREFADFMLSTTAYTEEQVVDARARLAGYLAELVALRRAHPTDDLLGALVAARDDEDRLSEEELIDIGITLLIAGHETTASELSNFIYVLLTEPGHWEALRARPELIPGAVEELLRHVQLSTGGNNPRVATEDVRLGDVTVSAGEAVIVFAQSANRDEAVFDHPDELDFTRHPNHHLAFGYGTHYCLGAQLGRMELQVALAALLRRFPSLRLGVPVEELPWKSGLLVRAPESLPVEW
ncbi:cytochrome [Parafrankia soli]|uniref:Cytochrome n=1 Tax=Parafrankia soli TaxID=2599596 RepID=A0A1S1PS31_9ACTN|nr:cytochrome P450 [Parafrankia soli]OHV24127.1 cytochrome [Parafrankia soli]